MSSFGRVEGVWLDRLPNLRNVVRQHVVREQLSAHLAGVTTALDVGCGQGTQAIALAASGVRVTAVDPSPELLGELRRAAGEHGVVVDAVPGGIEDLDALFAGQVFDLVCTHGLLMYLPDGFAALEQLTRRARPGGLVSFTVRNGDALAYRPGLRGQWEAALAAFETTRYVNDLGADARADRLADVESWCRSLGLDIEQWYGVRVLTEVVGGDVPPDPKTLDACLRAEVEAGRRDPYRRLGSQLHVVARRR